MNSKSMDGDAFKFETIASTSAMLRLTNWYDLSKKNLNIKSLARNAYRCALRATSRSI